MFTIMQVSTRLFAFTFTLQRKIILNRDQRGRGRVKEPNCFIVKLPKGSVSDPRLISSRSIRGSRAWVIPLLLDWSPHQFFFSFSFF